MSSTSPKEKIEYLCDFSIDCYTLLVRTVSIDLGSIIYDNNAMSMSESGNIHYLLLR